MKSHRRLSSLHNPLNFLKLIPTTLDQQAIPKKFTEKHGKYLLEKVKLNVPNGDVWQVDLKKSKDEIWFNNGWGDFLEHYGLKVGHLLVFKYEGSSIFGVVICDVSASEIVYPKKTKKDDDVRKSHVSCDELKTVKIEDEIWSEDENHGIRIYDEGECSKHGEIYQRIKDGRIALEKAKANFKCDKPFFMVYMHKTSLTNGVTVPIEFRRKLSKLYKNRRNYLLQLKNDERQKTWEVVARNTNLGAADWMMFVKDNGVAVGDICVFELMHEQHVLDVTILKSDS